MTCVHFCCCCCCCCVCVRGKFYFKLTILSSSSGSIGRVKLLVPVTCYCPRIHLKWVIDWNKWRREKSQWKDKRRTCHPPPYTWSELRWKGNRWTITFTVSKVDNCTYNWTISWKLRSERESLDPLDDSTLKLGEKASLVSLVACSIIQSSKLLVFLFLLAFLF